MRFTTRRPYLLIPILLVLIMLICPTTYDLSSRPRRMGWALGQEESVRDGLARWAQSFPHCRITAHHVYTSTHPVATSIEIMFSCTAP